MKELKPFPEPVSIRKLIGPSFVILALGFANLIADGFSMATGNYLGTQSEARLYKREHERESHIFDLPGHKGEREAAGILEGKGFTPDDASALSKIITKNKNFFLDSFFMKYVRESGSDDSSKISHHVIQSRQ